MSSEIYEEAYRQAALVRIRLNQERAELSGIINHPRTRRAQNTGDKAALNEVIDKVRAILAGDEG